MPSNPATTLLDRAMTLHRAGRLVDAKALYRDMLASNADDVDANYLLGLATLDGGNPGLAVNYLHKAVSLAPLNPLYHYNLGRAAAALGKPDEASGHLRKALALDPGHADARFALALALQQANRLDQAAAEYRTLLAVAPQLSGAWNNLGNTLNALARHGDAVDAFRQCLAIEPGYADGWSNLGNALVACGRLDEAESAYRKAIEADPAGAGHRYNLANLLFETFRYDAAIGAYEAAIERDPALAGAHNNLGNLLTKHGRLGEAERHLQRAIDLAPGAAQPYNNLGNVFSAAGDIGRAIECFERAVELDPGYADAFSNLLYSSLYPAEHDEAAIAQRHREWAGRFAAHLAPEPGERALRAGGERIRIGYISGDFRRHSVAFFFEPLLQHHDRTRFEVFLYSNVAVGDAITERMAATCDHWRSISRLDDTRAARLIRNDALDILVDLSGHTEGNRLLVLARRPAPVQVTWLGYPHTTGMDALDYRITDLLTDPGHAAVDALYSERLVRVTHSFLCYAGPDTPREARPPSAAPLVFGSFNNLTKMNHAVVAAWSRVLQQFAGARLLLKSHQLGDATTCERVAAQFAAHGVDADRLELIGRIPDTTAHLQLYSRVDIALDTFPYNGTTTTCEALWMGVPVVTLQGGCHRARVSAGILANLDLQHLVAATVEDMLTIIGGLDRDRAALCELGAGLRKRMLDSPLCDAAGFATRMETAFHAMLADRTAAGDA